MPYRSPEKHFQSINILAHAMFVCFGRISYQSLTCHSYGDVAIAGEGLQILNYSRHSCLLSSEGSLACHTNCDTMHPFIMVISEDL